MGDWWGLKKAVMAENWSVFVGGERVEREKGGDGEIEGITLARNTDRQLSVEN